jgi:hypothetical protein
VDKKVDPEDACENVVCRVAQQPKYIELFRLQSIAPGQTSSYNYNTKTQIQSIDAENNSLRKENAALERASFRGMQVTPSAGNKSIKTQGCA